MVRIIKIQRLDLEGCLFSKLKPSLKTIITADVIREGKLCSGSFSLVVPVVFYFFTLRIKYQSSGSIHLGIKAEGE
jgi:hypothetical protein